MTNKSRIEVLEKKANQPKYKSFSEWPKDENGIYINPTQKDKDTKFVFVSPWDTPLGRK